MNAQRNSQTNCRNEATDLHTILLLGPLKMVSVSEMEIFNLSWINYLDKARIKCKSFSLDFLI